MPKDVRVPPAKLKIGTNVPYPTVVLEIAHKNEPWNRLKQDASNKAFSTMTSIQVAIGVKIYKQHIRCFWGNRRANGSNITIREQTQKLEAYQVSAVVFTIPKNLVFWGIPSHLLPHTATPNLILPIETLRIAIADLIWVNMQNMMYESCWDIVLRSISMCLTYVMQFFVIRGFKWWDFTCN